MVWKEQNRCQWERSPSTSAPNRIPVLGTPIGIGSHGSGLVAVRAAPLEGRCARGRVRRRNGFESGALDWLRGLDLNQRSLGCEPNVRTGRTSSTHSDSTSRGRLRSTSRRGLTMSTGPWRSRAKGQDRDLAKEADHDSAKVVHQGHRLYLVPNLKLNDLGKPPYVASRPKSLKNLADALQQVTGSAAL